MYIQHICVFIVFNNALNNFSNRVATPEKKKAPVSKAKKAAAVPAAENGVAEPKPEETKEKQEKKPKETAESRKRAKPAKEVVAVKKPKSKLHSFLIFLSCIKLF